ncbi:MAG: hypothetical protein A3G76_00915 [Acidobacteria bacterium RIFCSPLOWO2_12_FULL_65_11]|nr:MAG: hypothetical protein A3H95_16175 [Acidobacteria bacterium RIFCSPLOWO2_02_FULL_64_15]OFW33373.1 MAG: hypothetical protein A3G76_00915 [Acidobacteria bacterium RIFCSPLOWO2_12_FULL_65_11]
MNKTLQIMAASFGLLMFQQPAAPRLMPYPQAKQPALELPPYQLPRPNDVIRATYKFAAEHPEVLGYMPCFCGCEMMGHKSNASCFVKTRARNGDVTAWDNHGIVCPMCLAVGEQAMRMHASGSSVQEIRAAVEEKYGGITEFKTPTPAPPRR